MRCAAALAALLPAAAGAFAQATCDADAVRARALTAREGLAGRYGSGPGMLAVAPCGDGYAVMPMVSANPALLQRVGTDRFAFRERPERQIRFRRSASGTIEAVNLVGTPDWLGLAGPDPELVELLQGHAEAAAQRVGRVDGPSLEAAVALADRVRSRLPSRRGTVARFLRLLEPQGSSSAALQRAYGDALAASGDTPSARRAFMRAAALGAEGMASRLRMTEAEARGKSGGWRLPFPVDALFESPREAELAAVRADWQTRRLEVSEVQEAARQSLSVDGSSRDAVLLTYLANGHRQYGLLLLPPSADGHCCAVVIDIPGTAPDHPPLDIGRQLPRSVRELGHRSDVLIALPALRGERLVFGGQTFTAEGDRRDGWDGAADDARALLSAVLAHQRQADPRRVCAFGHSRGGTVAMLAAARDRRFACVVAEAAPTDWFGRMPEDGWTMPVAVTEGLFSRSAPGAIGGQFIERFLEPVVAGSWSLQQARHRMLASSPLYFAAQLPPTLAIYGTDDASVDVGNGLALRQALAASAPGGHSQVLVQRATGHDLDPVATPQAAGEFLRRHLRLGTTAGVSSRPSRSLPSPRAPTSAVRSR